MTSSAEPRSLSGFVAEPSSLDPSSSTARTLGTSRRIRQLLSVSVDTNSVKELEYYISSASPSFSFGLPFPRDENGPDAVTPSGEKGMKWNQSDRENNGENINLHSQRKDKHLDVISSTADGIKKEELVSIQLATAAAQRSSLEERIMSTHRNFFSEFKKLYECVQSASYLVHNLVQQVEEMEDVLLPHGEAISNLAQHMRASRAALQREEEREAQIQALYEKFDFKPTDQELLLHGPVDVFFFDALERAKVAYKGSKAMLAEMQYHGAGHSNSSSSNGRDEDFRAREIVEPNSFFLLNGKSTDAVAQRVYDVGVGAYTAMTAAIQHLKTFLLTPVKQSTATSSSFRGGAMGGLHYTPGAMAHTYSNSALATSSSNAGIGGAGSGLTIAASMSADYPELSSFYLRCIRVLYDYDPSTWEHVIQVMADMRRSSVLRRYCHLLATGSATTAAGMYQYAGSHSVSLSDGTRSTSSSLCLRPLEADLDKPLYFFRALLAWMHQAIVAEMDLLSNFFFDVPSQGILTSTGVLSSGGTVVGDGAVVENSTLIGSIPSLSPSSVSLMVLIAKVFDHTTKHLENAMNGVLDRFLPSVCTLPAPPSPLLLPRTQKKRIFYDLFSSGVTSSVDPTDSGGVEGKDSPSNGPSSLATVVSSSSSTSNDASPSGSGGKLSFGRHLVSRGFRRIFKPGEVQKIPREVGSRLEKERVLVTPVMLAQQLHLPSKNSLEAFVSSSRSQQIELAEAFLYSPLSGMKELFRLQLLFGYYSKTVVGPLLGETSKMWILINVDGAELLQQAFIKVLTHFYGHLFRSTLMLIVSSPQLKQLEESSMLEKTMGHKATGLAMKDPFMSGVGVWGIESRYWFQTAVRLLQQQQHVDWTSFLWTCFPSSFSFHVIRFLFTYQRQEIDAHGAIFKTQPLSSHEKDAYQFLDKIGSGAKSDEGKGKSVTPHPSSGAVHTSPETSLRTGLNVSSAAALVYGGVLMAGKKSDPMLHAAAKELEKNLSQVLLTPPVEVHVIVEALKSLRQEYEKQQSILDEVEHVQQLRERNEGCSALEPSSFSSMHGTKAEEVGTSSLSLLPFSLHPYLLSVVRFLLLDECGCRAIESSSLLSQRLDTPCQYILLLNISHAVARGISAITQKPQGSKKSMASTSESPNGQEEGSDLPSTSSRLYEKRKAYQLVLAVPSKDKNGESIRVKEESFSLRVPPPLSSTPVSRVSTDSSIEPSEVRREADEGKEGLHYLPHSSSLQELGKSEMETRLDGMKENITVGKLCRTYQFIVSAAICVGALHHYFPVSLFSSSSAQASLLASPISKAALKEEKWKEKLHDLQSITEQDSVVTPSLEMLLCVVRQLLFFFRLIERLRDEWSLPLLSSIEEDEVRMEVDLAVRRALLAHYAQMYQEILLHCSDPTKLQESFFTDSSSEALYDPAPSSDTQDKDRKRELMDGLQQLSMCTPDSLEAILCKVLTTCF